MAQQYIVPNSMALPAVYLNDGGNGREYMLPGGAYVNEAAAAGGAGRLALLGVGA